MWTLAAFVGGAVLGCVSTMVCGLFYISRRLNTPEDSPTDTPSDTHASPTNDEVHIGDEHLLRLSELVDDDGNLVQH